MEKVSLYLHLLGVGMLLSLLFVSPFAEKALRKSSPADAVTIHRFINQLGVLSPFAVALLLFTGVGNIIVFHVSLKTAQWLQAKLLFYFVLLLIGAVNGPFLKRRLELYRARAEKQTPELDARIAAFNTREAFFLIWQWILVLLIIALSVFR